MSGEISQSLHVLEYEPGEKPHLTPENYEETAKFFFDAFKLYLVQDVDWMKLLLSYEYFDATQIRKLYQNSSNLRQDEVILEMFLEIEKSDHQDRFTKLVQAFRKCKNEKAVSILEGKVIPSDSRARDLIMKNGNYICDDMLTDDILPVLLAKGAIQEKDVNYILAKKESNGRWRANFELLFILPTKICDWFKVFMEALIEIDQVELADKIKSGLNADIPQSADGDCMSMDLASCQPIQNKDQIKGAGLTKGVIKENVMSDFRDPSLSINNLSPNKPEDAYSSIDSEAAKKSLNFDMLADDEENVTESVDSMMTAPGNASIASSGAQSLTENFSCLLSLDETGRSREGSTIKQDINRSQQPQNNAQNRLGSGRTTDVDQTAEVLDEMERQLQSLDVNDVHSTNLKALDLDTTELKRRAIEGNDDARNGARMKNDNAGKRKDLDRTERKRLAIEGNDVAGDVDRKPNNITGNRDNSARPVSKELKDKQVFDGCSGAEHGNMNITEAESVPQDDDAEDETEDEDISLRKYQEELAKPALEGKNVIIVAPTGSGKTRVALRIIQEHIRNQRGRGIAKVIFLVNQVALANQQGAACLSQLPQYKSKVISGESQRSKSECLRDFIDRRDILIVTAQVLLDSLVQGEISSISVFSLMVFDECHHTHANHAFNQIMGMYMKQKFEEDQEKSRVLPQIVGLTASVGVGKAKNMDKAQAHIKSLMANLDAEVICTVHDNMEELRAFVSLPEEETCTVPKRQNDVFGANVTKLISMIEQRMTSSSVVKEMPGAAQFEPVLKSPAQKGNAQYTQWVSKLIKETAKLQSQEARRFLIPCRAHLEYYNNALIIHNDARVEDAMSYLEMEMSRWRETALMNSNEKKLNEAYERLKSAARRDTSENPKLKKLEELILKVYKTERGKDSRGIVFVKTRDLAKAIVSWMKETPGLRELNPIPFLGQNQSSVKGGMTKVEQDDALKYFRDGKHKLIVATSVAEEGLDISKCNLVIRYDHVTNEIAMVQSRGRGRAQDSKYCVIAESGTGMAEKEELNMIREILMRKAIIKLQEDILKDPAKFRLEIHNLQEEANLDRKLKALGRKGKLIRTGEFELRCFRCNQFICMSSDIKKIQHAHHVIVDDTIEERVKMLKLEPMKYTDSTTEIGGKQICKACGDNLGPICIHRSIEFPVAKIEKFLIVDINGRQDLCNRWKSAPFKVADLTTEDWKDIIKNREIK